MRLLLDTHILLWCASGNLPSSVESFISNQSNILCFSPISIWEITIKMNLGRDDFRVNPCLLYNGLTANGYQEINITSRHTLGITTLPDLHKDPFDRLLLAQAISEGMHFLTCDALMADYGEPVICVKK